MTIKNEDELQKIMEYAQHFDHLKEEKTFLYLMPDEENEFEKVFEIKDPQSYETKEQWMNIMAEACADYSRNYEFYDSMSQGISDVELVLHAIKTHKIPLVRYWTSAKVEKLSALWLRRQS